VAAGNLTHDFACRIHRKVGFGFHPLHDDSLFVAQVP
jgi:hypothetical protein